MEKLRWLLSFVGRKPGSGCWGTAGFLNLCITARNVREGQGNDLSLLGLAQGMSERV